MKTAGICFLILGGVLLLISGFYYGVYLIFEKLPHKTERALGRLCRSKYKKDVPVWTGLGRYDGPPRIAYYIKHLTKTKYVYRVDKKLHRCAFNFLRKPSKVPEVCWVIYLKAFPRISYLENEENCMGADGFWGKALIFFALTLFALGVGAYFLLKV